MADHRGQRDDTEDGGQLCTTEDGGIPAMAHETAISNPPPLAFLHSITAIEQCPLGSPLAIICDIWSPDWRARVLLAPRCRYSIS